MYLLHPQLGDTKRDRFRTQGLVNGMTVRVIWVVPVVEEKGTFYLTSIRVRFVTRIYLSDSVCL